jgi:hypothetical protein
MSDGSLIVLLILRHSDRLCPIDALAALTKSASRNHGLRAAPTEWIMADVMVPQRPIYHILRDSQATVCFTQLGPVQP